MARSNLYLVHVFKKNHDSNDGYFLFYNRRSAESFISECDSSCFVDLHVFLPDNFGMYHLKI